MNKIVACSLCACMSMTCFFGCGKEEQKKEETVQEESETRKGADAEHAIRMSVDDKFKSKVESDVWYKFKTEKDDEHIYKIVVVNTSGKGDITVSICDEFGDEIDFPNSVNIDGSPETCTVSDVEDNTMYFIHIHNNRPDDCKSVKFSVTLKAIEG